MINITRHNSVLLIVDMQAKLAPAISEFTAAAEVLSKTQHIAKLMQIPCVLTEQNPAGLGTSISMLQTTLRVEKHTFATPVAELQQVLGAAFERNTFVLGGVESHVCVLQTAEALLQAGKQVVLLADGVASRKPENVNWALQHLRQLGAAVLPYESVVFKWLESCQDAHFKAALQQIK
ncbi:isochorismatase family protein [Pseudoalteromonas fenneropenaei]|uniref:Isochorismatase family protein n=1 Tax=Pseudoalteromonas fenneropenaei TaxID=1737459 RepID=A0ABV7CJP0_9GAMM